MRPGDPGAVTHGSTAPGEGLILMRRRIALILASALLLASARPGGCRQASHGAGGHHRHRCARRVPDRGVRLRRLGRRQSATSRSGLPRMRPATRCARSTTSRSGSSSTASSRSFNSVDVGAGPRHVPGRRQHHPRDRPATSSRSRSRARVGSSRTCGQSVFHVTFPEDGGDPIFELIRRPGNHTEGDTTPIVCDVLDG